MYVVSSGRRQKGDNMLRKEDVISLVEDFIGALEKLEDVDVYEEAYNAVRDALEDYNEDYDCCKDCECKSDDIISTLEDTVDMMISDSWSERFFAELIQAKLRRDKLEDALVKIALSDEEYNEEEIELLKKQHRIMSDYIDVLEERADLYSREGLLDG